MPMAQVNGDSCLLHSFCQHWKQINPFFQQFPLKDCFPKLLHHITAFVSVIFRKEVNGMILKKNLLKGNKIKGGYLCSPDLGLGL